MYLVFLSLYNLVFQGLSLKDSGMDSEGCSDYEGDQGQDLVLLRKIFGGVFPGGPVVRTQCSHCRGQGFDPGLGN